MQLRDTLRYVVVICLLILGQITTYGQKHDSLWVKTNEGCKVYSLHSLKKNEIITWSGNCIGGFAYDSGTLTWHKKGKMNEEYIGVLKRGIPNGYGKYNVKGRSFKEGNFVNGELIGCGKYINSKSNKKSSYYEGVMKNGERNGYGKFVLFDVKDKLPGDTASIYCGYFENGNLNGDGFIKEFLESGKEKIMAGIFKDGQLNKNHVNISLLERGILIEYYTGPIQNHKRSGYGQEIRGKTIYKGYWKNDLMHGKGTLEIDSILIYDGDFKYGQFHGIGKRFYLDGSFYVGEFVNGYRHGIGILCWKNGARYIGEFENDLLSGIGYTIEVKSVGLAGFWKLGSIESPDTLANVKKILREQYSNRIQRFEIMAD